MNRADLTRPGWPPLFFPFPARPVRMPGKRHSSALAQAKLTPSDAPHFSDPNSSGTAEPTTIASRVWSGYMVTTEQSLPISQVFGAWSVPAVGPTWDFPAAYTASAEWVGIDGWGTPDVIQDGTEQDVSGYYGEGEFEFESYYAWYEYFPDTEQAISGLDVQPGDQISAIAWIDQAADDIHAAGNYIVINYSTGQGVFESETEPAGAGYPSGTTVEWIVERPTDVDTQTPYPLANYGATQITSAVYSQMVWPQGMGNAWFSDAPPGSIGNNFFQIFMTQDGTLNTPFLSVAYPLQNDGTIGFIFDWSN